MSPQGSLTHLTIIHHGNYLVSLARVGNFFSISGVVNRAFLDASAWNEDEDVFVGILVYSFKHAQLSGRLLQLGK